MMLLSRFWYVVVSLVAAAALYVAYLAVGQFNRQGALAASEEVASDSQTVGWALQLDARRRLDALLVGAVDKGVQESLLAANGKDTVPATPRANAKRALAAVLEKIPADYRPDALFAVDRDGRIVGHVGFDQAAAFEDMELGGNTAVFDALHGYLRDDTWVWGGRLYRVVVRPVEYEAGAAPVGAIVGIRLVDVRFATELAKRTRANIAFYTGTQRVAAASADPAFEEGTFEQLTDDLGQVAQDKGFKESGRSEVRLPTERTTAMYARLLGDAWELGGSFAVVRTRVPVASPMGFLQGADDKDKASVPVGVLAAFVLLAIGVGIGLTVLEHGLPLRELVRQAAGLKAGPQDGLQIARFRGAYRTAATDINEGISRIAEKGGASRKPADLESILGPTPAQPAMSAFALPPQGGAGGAGGVPAPPTSAPMTPFGSPPAAPSPPAGVATPHGAPPFAPPPSAGLGAPIATPMASPAFPVGAAAAGPVAIGTGGLPMGAPPPPRAPAVTAPGVGAGFPAPNTGSHPVVPPSVPGGSGAAPAVGRPPPPAAPPAPRPPPPARAPQSQPQLPNMGDDEEEGEATMVAAIPREVLQQATGEHNSAATEEGAEWLGVYEDFLRTKRQCNEPTDGLTFEKFQHTLRKNRDALIQRHGCKRVKFSVYVKDGKASLKATPVRD